MKTYRNFILLVTLGISLTAIATSCAGDGSSEDGESAEAKPVEVTPTQDINVFWPQFQAAVAQNDKDAVVKMTDFPLRGTDYTLNNPESPGMVEAAFLQNYDAIFTEEMRDAIAATPVDKLGLMRAHEGNNLTMLTQAPQGSPMYTIRTEAMENLGTAQERLVRRTYIIGLRDDVLKFMYILRM